MLNGADNNYGESETDASTSTRSHLKHRAALGIYCYSQFTNEGLDAQRGLKAAPRTHSQEDPW